MAKRQNFVIGSTNSNTETQTVDQLNRAWDMFAILRSGKLDGVFNAVSDYSNDSSNEIANAILSITGSQPTGNSQDELAGALQQMRDEITTSSLRFVGYVATSAPSASTYALIEGNLWLNSATMPTVFPVAASDIKQWDGSAWVNYGSTYTPSNFECWRNVNDTNGYYWFGGRWTVMSTDMSVDYFTLNASGKWEIKSNVNLPGEPTISTTPTTTDNTTKIASTEFVINILKLMYPVGTGIFVGTGNTCPMAALFGTWELVSSGRALWTGDGSNGNTTIEAGLPNITGSLKLNDDIAFQSSSGAFTLDDYYARDVSSNRSGSQAHTANFSASKSSGVYGNSNTVQPPAYVVNVWRRTA